MRPDEYSVLDGSAIVELVQRGEVSPGEIYEAACERIDALNPELNAIVRSMDETAAEQLATLDQTARGRRHRYRDEDGNQMLLAGLPMLLKDNLPVAGTLAASGSNLLTDKASETTHPVAERLRAAGAVFAGRSNMPEFGILPFTEPALYGPARNPWNLDCTTGGSSGGSAAAVAAGIVPVAHGNDGGGSIRIPASACGVFGLKPSRGRNPGTHPGYDAGLGVQHVLTRTVRDSALVLDVTAGGRPGDYWKLPLPEVPYRELVTRDPGSLRIGFVTHDFSGHEVDAACARAVREIAAHLAGLGHIVDEVAPAIDGEAFNEAFKMKWSQGAGVVVKGIRDAILEDTRRPAILRTIVRSPAVLRAFLRRYRRNGRTLLEHFTLRLAEIDAGFHPSDLYAAERVFAATERALVDFFTDWDLLLTPVLSGPPGRIGSFDPAAPIPRAEAHLFRYAGFTPIANTSGYPAMSVPALVTEDRLPVGTHFIAPIGREDRLLQVAAQIESSRGWATEIPPR